MQRPLDPLTERMQRRVEKSLGDSDAAVLVLNGEHEVGPGFVHFAVIATVAEVAAAGAVGASVVPAQISLNLLSPAKSGRLVGRGNVIRRGKRLRVIVRQ